MIAENGGELGGGDVSLGCVELDNLATVAGIETADGGLGQAPDERVLVRRGAGLEGFEGRSVGRTEEGVGRDILADEVRLGRLQFFPAGHGGVGGRQVLEDGADGGGDDGGITVCIVSMMIRDWEVGWGGITTRRQRRRRRGRRTGRSGSSW